MTSSDFIAAEVDRSARVPTSAAPRILLLCGEAGVSNASFETPTWDEFRARRLRIGTRPLPPDICCGSSHPLLASPILAQGVLRGWPTRSLTRGRYRAPARCLAPRLAGGLGLPGWPVRCRGPDVTLLDLVQQRVGGHRSVELRVGLQPLRGRAGDRGAITSLSSSCHALAPNASRSAMRLRSTRPWSAGATRAIVAVRASARPWSA